MNRWAIYIDIEGFGTLWDCDTNIRQSLGSLLEGAALIGSRVYPEPVQRLFVHQIGDGIIIVSDFDEQTLERPVAIAIALMRHVAANGRFAKAVIAEGDFADIRGYYPRLIRDGFDSSHTRKLGAGLMTIFSVMGTALVRAVRLEESSPSGSLLLVSSKDVGPREQYRLCRSLRVVEIPECGVLSIDWIHSELPLAHEIQQNADLRWPTNSQIEASMATYFRQKSPPLRWRANTSVLLSLQDGFVQ